MNRCGARGGFCILPLVSLYASALSAQTFDTTAVRNAFRLYERTCALPAARAWSTDVCGPLVLVDRETRYAFASRPDPDRAFARSGSLYSGPAPASTPFANTSFRWGKERWAAVMLPLPRTEFGRIVLLAHEATHRVQIQCGGAVETPSTRISTRSSGDCGGAWSYERGSLRSRPAAVHNALTCSQR